MYDLISNPFGFMLLWFDVGLFLMIFGEYWFTIRKGHKINVTGKYILIFFGLSFLGILLINRVISELFNEHPEFLTSIDYTVAIKDSYLTTTEMETIEL